MIMLSRTPRIWILIYALEYVVSANASSSHNSIWTNIKSPQLGLAPYADFGSGNYSDCHLMYEIAIPTNPTRKKWYRQREVYINSKQNSNPAALVSRNGEIYVGLVNLKKKMLKINNVISAINFQMNKSKIKNQIYDINNEKSMKLMPCKNIDRELLEEIRSKNTCQRREIDKSLNFATIDNNLWKQPSITKAGVTNKYNKQPFERLNDIRTPLTERHKYLIKKGSYIFNWDISHRVKSYKRYISDINNTHISCEIPNLAIEKSDQINRKIIYKGITPEIAKCQAQTYNSGNSIFTSKPETTYDSYYNIPVGNINIIYGPLYKNEPLKAILKKIYLIILNGFKPIKNDNICLRRLSPLQQNTLKIPYVDSSKRPCYMVPTYGLQYENNFSNLNEKFKTHQESKLSISKYKDPLFITSYQTNKQCDPYRPNDVMGMVYNIPSYRFCQQQLAKQKSLYQYKPEKTSLETDISLSNRVLQDNEERKMYAQRRRPQISLRWPFITISNPYAIAFSSFKSTVPIYLPTSTAKSTLTFMKIPHSLPYCCYFYKSDLSKTSTDTSKNLQQPNTKSNAYYNLRPCLIINSYSSKSLYNKINKASCHTSRPTSIEVVAERIEPVVTYLKCQPQRQNYIENHIPEFHSVPNHFAKVFKSKYQNPLLLNNIQPSVESPLLSNKKQRSLNLNTNTFKLMPYALPEILTISNENINTNKVLPTNLYSKPCNNLVEQTQETYSNLQNGVPKLKQSFEDSIVNDNLNINLQLSDTINFKNKLKETSHLHTQLENTPNLNNPKLNNILNTHPNLKIPYNFEDIYPLIDLGMINECDYIPDSHSKSYFDESPELSFESQIFPSNKHSSLSLTSPIQSNGKREYLEWIQKYHPVQYIHNHANNIEISPSNISSKKFQVTYLDTSLSLNLEPQMASIGPQTIIPSVSFTSPSYHRFVLKPNTKTDIYELKHYHTQPFSQISLAFPDYNRYKPIKSSIKPKKLTVNLESIPKSGAKLNPKMDSLFVVTPDPGYISSLPITNQPMVKDGTNLTPYLLNFNKQISQQNLPYKLLSISKDFGIYKRPSLTYLSLLTPVNIGAESHLTPSLDPNFGCPPCTSKIYSIPYYTLSSDTAQSDLIQRPYQKQDRPIVYSKSATDRNQINVPKTDKNDTVKYSVPKYSKNSSWLSPYFLCKQYSPNNNAQIIPHSNQILSKTLAGQNRYKPKSSFTTPNMKINFIKLHEPASPSISTTHKKPTLNYRTPALSSSPEYIDPKNNIIFKTPNEVVHPVPQKQISRKPLELTQSLRIFPTQAAAITSQTSPTLVQEKNVNVHKPMCDQSQLPFNQIILVPLEPKNYNLNKPALYNPPVLDSSIKPNKLSAILELDPKIISKLQPETYTLKNVPRTENVFSLPLTKKPVVQEETIAPANLLDTDKRIPKQNIPYILQSVLKDFGITRKKLQYLSPLNSLNIGPGSHFLPSLEPNLVYPPSTSNKYPMLNSSLSGPIQSITMGPNHKQDRPIIYSTSPRDINHIKFYEQIYKTESVPKINKKYFFKQPDPKYLVKTWLPPLIISKKYPQTKRNSVEIIPYSSQIQSQTLPLQSVYSPMSSSEPTKKSITIIHKNPPANYRTPVQLPSEYYNSPRNKVTFKTLNEICRQTQEQINRTRELPRETLNQDKGINKITHLKDLAFKTQKHNDTNRYKSETTTKELKPINVDLQLVSTQLIPNFLSVDKPLAVNYINHKLLFDKPTLPSDSQIFGVPLEQAPVQTMFNSEIPRNVHMINEVPVKTFRGKQKVPHKKLSTNRLAQSFFPNQIVHESDTESLQFESKPLLMIFDSQSKKTQRYLKIEKPSVGDDINHKHPKVKSNAQNFRVLLQQTPIETSYNSPNLLESTHYAGRESAKIPLQFASYTPTTFDLQHKLLPKTVEIIQLVQSFPTFPAIIPAHNRFTLIPDKNENVHKSMYNQPKLPSNEIRLVPLEPENHNINKSMLYTPTIIESLIKPYNLPVISESDPKIISKLQPATNTLVNMPRADFFLFSSPLPENPLVQKNIKLKPNSPDDGKQISKQNLPSVLKVMGIYKKPQYLSTLTPTSNNVNPTQSIPLRSYKKQVIPINYCTSPRKQLNKPAYKTGVAPKLNAIDVFKLPVPNFFMNSSWLSPSLLPKEYPETKRNNAEIIPNTSQILTQTIPFQNLYKPMLSSEPLLQPPLSRDSRQFTHARAPMETSFNTPLSKNLHMTYPFKPMTDKQLFIKTPDQPYSPNKIVQETTVKPLQFVSKTPSTYDPQPRQILKYYKIDKPDINADIKHKILFNYATIPSDLQMFGMPVRQSPKETVSNSPNLLKSHKSIPIFLANAKHKSQQILPHKSQFISKYLGICKNPQYISSPLTSLNIGPDSHFPPSLNFSLNYNLVNPSSTSTSNTYSFTNTLSTGKVKPALIQGPYQKQERPIAYSISTRDSNQIKIPKTEVTETFEMPDSKYPIDTSWLSSSLQSTKYQQTKDVIPHSNEILNQTLLFQNHFTPISTLTCRTPVQSPSEYINPGNKMMIKPSYIVLRPETQISIIPLEPTRNTLDETKRVNQIAQPKDIKFLLPKTQKLYRDANKNTPGPITGELVPILALQQLKSTQQTPTFSNIKIPPVIDLKQELLSKQPAISSNSKKNNILLQQSPMSTSYNFPNLSEPPKQNVQESIDITSSSSDFQPNQSSKTIEILEPFQPLFNQVFLDPENYDKNKPTLDISSILNRPIRPYNLPVTLKPNPTIISKLKPETYPTVNTARIENLYLCGEPQNQDILGQEEINPTLNLLGYKQASKQNLPYNLQNVLKDFGINKNPHNLNPFTLSDIGSESYSPPTLKPKLISTPCTSKKYLIPNTDSIQRPYEKQQGPIFYSIFPRDTIQLKSNQLNDMSRLPKIKSHLNIPLSTESQRTSSPDLNTLNKQLPKQKTYSSKETYNLQYFSKPIRDSILADSKLLGIHSSKKDAIRKSPYEQSSQEYIPITCKTSSNRQQHPYYRYLNTPNVFANQVKEQIKKPLKFATNTPSTFSLQSKPLQKIIDITHPSKSLYTYSVEYEKGKQRSFLDRKYNNDFPKIDLKYPPPLHVKTIKPKDTGNMQMLSSPLNEQKKQEELFTTPRLHVKQPVIQHMPYYILPHSPSSPQGYAESLNTKEYPNTVPKVHSFSFTGVAPLDSNQLNTPLVANNIPSAFNSHSYVLNDGPSFPLSGKTFTDPLLNNKVLKARTKMTSIANPSLQKISPKQLEENEFASLFSQLNIEFPTSLSFNQPLSHELLKPTYLLIGNSDKSKSSKYNLWPINKLKKKAIKGLKTQDVFIPDEYSYSSQPNYLLESEFSSEKSSTPGSAPASTGSVTLSAPETISNNPISNRKLHTRNKNTPLYMKQNPYLDSLFNDNVIATSSNHQCLEYVHSEPSLEIHPSTIIEDNNKAYQSSNYTVHKSEIPNYVDHNVPIISSTHQDGPLNPKSLYISSPPEIAIEAFPEYHDATSLDYPHFPIPEKNDSNFEDKSVQNILGVNALSKEYIPEETLQNISNESDNYNPSLFESQISALPLKTNSILEAIRKSLGDPESPLNSKICKFNTDYKTKQITIPLGELGIAKYEPTNIHEFCLETDNPDIFLQAWSSKLKVIKPKLVFDVKDYEAINFMPVVKDNYYPPDLIQDIAKDIITKLYSEPIVIHGVYSYYKPYAIVDYVNYNFMRSGCAYILWPTFCDCGCMQSGCSCKYR